MKCRTGKVQFRDEKNAIFYIKKLQSTSCRETVPQRAYLCEYCFQWHLTSKKQSPKEIDERVDEYFIYVEKHKWESKLKWISKYQEKIRNYKKLINQLTNKNIELKRLLKVKN